MPIDWTVLNGWVDDDGTNTVGTLVTKAALQAAIRDPIDAGLSAAGAMSFLGSGSGTTTSTSAENLDTVAITGLTALDSLMIYYNFNCVTQGVGALLIRNETDTTTLSDIGSAAAAAGKIGYAELKQAQVGATTIHTFALRTDFTGTQSIDGRSVSVTTGWTSSWTLSLRQPGVTSGGTLHWSWAVYKIAGQ